MNTWQKPEIIAIALPLTLGADEGNPDLNGGASF